jgi:LacI family transcriptional regulator
MPRPKMADVARKAGVDRSTASRALDPERAHMLKPETIERVTAAARELGYHGNVLASSLRKGRTNSVGVVIADFQNPFIAPVLRGLGKELDRLGIVPVVAETEDSSARLESVLRTMLSHRPDAVIITAVRRNDRALVAEINKTVPVILVARTFRDNSFPAVAHDDQSGGALAAGHLLSLGHTRLVQLCGPRDESSFIDRALGFRRTLRAAGVTSTNLSDPVAAPGAESGYRLMGKALRNAAEMPTAVFAHTDLMAVGAIDAAKAAGLRCPDDISVIGYDDIPLADHVNPPLTTVRLPGHELGQFAAELVGKIIDGKPTDGVHFSFPPDLIVRESTRPVVNRIDSPETTS